MNKPILQRLLHSVAICGVAGLLVGGIATTAVAADQFTPGETTKVRFGDLNLASPAGAAELYRRISGAARRVCSDTSVHYEMPMLRQIRECERIAVANAVSAVNSTQLTALHNGKDKGKQHKFG